MQNFISEEQGFVVSIIFGMLRRSYSLHVAIGLFTVSLNLTIALVNKLVLLNPAFNSNHPEAKKNLVF